MPQGVKIHNLGIMADYWISNPRHYCEACKCWFGDNKISVEFHESGRRHKANVERQLRESRKRAAINDKEAMKLSETLDQIEKAAMVSYQRDQMGLPPSKKVATTTGVSLTPEMIQFEQQNIKKEMSKILKEKQKKYEEEKLSSWQQLVTPEGYTYYYNNVTGESQWESPIATNVQPIATNVQPIATNVPPITTTVVSPIATTVVSPIATTVSPIATTVSPIATTVPPIATTVVSPIATTVSPIATTVSPIATTVSPIATTVPPIATTVSPTMTGCSANNRYGNWTTIAIYDQQQEVDTPPINEDTPPNDNDDESLSDNELFTEKILPTQTIETGTFKGFSFKKKPINRRTNIKDRTSDW